MLLSLQHVTLSHNFKLCSTERKYVKSLNHQNLRANLFAIIPILMGGICLLSMRDLLFVGNGCNRKKTKTEKKTLTLFQIVAKSQ